MQGHILAVVLCLFCYQEKSFSPNLTVHAQTIPKHISVSKTRLPLDWLQLSNRLSLLAPTAEPSASSSSSYLGPHHSSHSLSASQQVLHYRQQPGQTCNDYHYWLEVCPSQVGQPLRDYNSPFHDVV